MKKRFGWGGSASSPSSDRSKSKREAQKNYAYTRNQHPVTRPTPRGRQAWHRNRTGGRDLQSHTTRLQVIGFTTNLAAGERVLPPASLGPTCTRNAEGWVKQHPTVTAEAIREILRAFLIVSLAAQDNLVRCLADCGTGKASAPNRSASSSSRIMVSARRVNERIRRPSRN